MPMPIDVYVTYTDGSVEVFNIPLQVMRGHKAAEQAEARFTVAEDWPWTHPTYELMINKNQSTIQKVEIDPTKRLADVNGQNNVLEMK
jgi:hypothetical protein